MQIPQDDCAALALTALSEYISSHPSLAARSEERLLSELRGVFAAQGRYLDTFRICFHLVTTYRWPMTDEGYEAVSAGWDAVRLSPCPRNAKECQL